MLLLITIFLLAFAYLAWHLWIIMPSLLWLRISVVVIEALALSMGIAAATPLLDKLPIPLASFVYNFGNKSLIAMLYLLLFFLLMDILRLLHVVPSQCLKDNLLMVIVVALCLCVLLIYGSIHYHHKKPVRVNITAQKELDKPLTIVAISDLHIGYHNRLSDLHKWVEIINQENPDIILIAGDIVDGSIHAIEKQNMAQQFHNLSAPVYACMGNHEYYAASRSSMDRILSFYKEAGITLLRDTCVSVMGLNLVGRDDRSNAQRLSIDQIINLSCANKNLFTILLDHQPYHLEEAEHSAIDFQFSGHTHRGQVWPLSWIVDANYECSWGSHRRGTTHYYVSSGLGIWGAKYRIGTQSEYLVLNLK